jgi:hypothetical protein
MIGEFDPTTQPHADMMSRRRIIAALISIGMFPSPALAAAAGAVKTSVGANSAEVDGIRRRLRAGAELFVGDLVRTETPSRLVMLLGKATRVCLGGDAEFHIDRFIAGVSGEFHLEGGALLLDHDAHVPGADLQIHSPYGTVAVRRSRFFAGPSDGAFGVFVTRGSVQFTAGGTTVRLQAGEGTDVRRPGDPPGRARQWAKARLVQALSDVG